MYRINKLICLCSLLALGLRIFIVVIFRFHTPFELLVTLIKMPLCQSGILFMDYIICLKRTFNSRWWPKNLQSDGQFPSLFTIAPYLCRYHFVTNSVLNLVTHVKTSEFWSSFKVYSLSFLFYFLSRTWLVEVQFMYWWMMHSLEDQVTLVTNNN